MTAYRTTALVMLAVFLMIYALGAALYIHQARLDVQRELDGVAGLALALGPPSTLPAAAVSALRHLHPADEAAPAGTAPDRFRQWLVDGAGPRTIHGWRLDPADEVAEIWEGFLLVSLAYGLGLVLCFLALFQVVRRGVRPLWDLAAAMDQIAGGRLDARLPRQGVRELDALARRFNHMAGALQAEQDTVRRLLHELLQLQDRERAHIARVLHDDLGQYLTGIRAQARSWLYDPDLGEHQRRQARDLERHCATVQRHFRHLLQDLHPLVMEQLGLASAIRHLAEQWQRLSGLRCELALDERLPALSGEQQTHLYRFLQEALNNVSRHAHASHARLAVVCSAGRLQVDVRDDGVGSAQLMTRAGLGLRSMRERARCLGGRVQFFSAEGRGTRIRLSVPLPAAVPVPGDPS